MTDSEKNIVTNEMRTRIRSLGTRFPDFNSALIPALWMIQHEYGHISIKAMEEVAEVFDVHPAHVESVLSFYTMYFDKPVGRHLIQVCRSLSCMLKESDGLLKHIKEYLEVESGETTSDGVFTLLEVECLGACGESPVIQFDYDYHENMTWEKTKTLIDKHRQKSLQGGTS